MSDQHTSDEGGAPAGPTTPAAGSFGQQLAQALGRPAFGPDGRPSLTDVPRESDQPDAGPGPTDISRESDQPDAGPGPTAEPPEPDQSQRVSEATAPGAHDQRGDAEGQGAPDTFEGGPPVTGDPAVDAALAAAAAAQDADPAAQLETYVGTHRALQDRLADSGA